MAASLDSPCARRRFAMDVPVRDASRTEGADMSVISEELGPQTTTVCVVGLGYVGLPVAVELGKQRPTIGFDLATKKVERLKQFNDATGEVPSDELRRARMLQVTDDPEQIRTADYIIVAVPTPVNEARQPDFSPLESASEIVGKHMKKGAIVVYES